MQVETMSSTEEMAPMKSNDGDSPRSNGDVTFVDENGKSSSNEIYPDLKDTKLE